ncbi:transcriptional regulator, HxlR family [Treponema primitia ZAS-2]|uniref:Transcriptional regulator, HxlR family n=1 Tax=Treponema primitia (strain ATCC BAA-887 / DSM 12427 / ZAS-2) TaxID=545694 RepID=F5YIQ2_TREPZ|nr:helix-turn-helix domain-containing protein [Treponema primitia]AEF85359.1 transcriptional regulator, HxlR family [Treponema primitia ZAS-2]
MEAPCNDKTCDKCPCMESCPLESALRIIGGKWKIPILCSLHQDGATRYNGLKRKIRGITNTVLASSLKELEEAGLISRRQFAEIPVRVEYSLTQACDTLLPILNQLSHWGAALQKTGTGI